MSMMMTCGYCAERFSEDQGQPACATCPLNGGCRFVRCPHCGYENPCEPEWLARLRRWLKDDDVPAARSAEVDATRDAKEAVSAP